MTLKTVDEIMQDKGIPSEKPGMIADKICPFMSKGDPQVACTPQCKLYRHNTRQNGYECPIQELAAISFAVRPRR